MIKATRKGHKNILKNLLLTGANVNFICEPKSSVKSHEIGEEVSTKTFPLFEAINNSHLHIVRLLLQHGAKIDSLEDCKDSNVPTEVRIPFLRAVQKCKESRGNRDRLDILKELIAHGADINVTFGEHDNYPDMNGLHLALFGSLGGTNDSLDLEMTLIKNKINVWAESCGRYPLHELFRWQPEAETTQLDCSIVKETMKDPIEVSHVIIEAMGDKSYVASKINKTDDLGRSPLHYAAHCGATICCLLLIERGKFSQQLTASLFLIVAALGTDCVIF